MQTPSEPHDENRSRRWMNALMGAGVLGSIASFVYPAIRYLLPPRVAEALSRSAVAAKVGELRPNSGKIFKFGSVPGMLINTPEGQLRAFSATCTHLSCTVQYRAELQRIWCACHNGMYDLNGQNVGGPPPRPLEQYQVHVQGDEVVVTRGT